MYIYVFFLFFEMVCMLLIGGGDKLTQHLLPSFYCKMEVAA